MCASIYSNVCIYLQIFLTDFSFFIADLNSFSYSLTLILFLFSKRSSLHQSMISFVFLYLQTLDMYIQAVHPFSSIHFIIRSFSNSFLSGHVLSLCLIHAFYISFSDLSPLLVNPTRSFIHHCILSSLLHFTRSLNYNLVFFPFSNLIYIF